MFLFLATFCLLTSVTQSEKVPWLTAHNRCRDTSGYIADIDKADHWLPDFWIKAYFKPTGCFYDSIPRSPTTVANRTECYLQCTARNYSLFGVREIKEDTVDCFCLDTDDVKRYAAYTPYRDNLFYYCWPDNYVFVFEETTYSKGNFYMYIKCNDRKADCVAIMKNNHKVTQYCHSIHTYGSRLYESCSNNKFYECEGSQLTTTTPIMSLMTSSKPTKTSIATVTRSTVSSVSVSSKTTTILADMPASVANTSNENRSTLPFPTTEATDDITEDNIQENLTNSESTILKEPNPNKDKSSGVPTLEIAIGTLVGIVVLTVILILLIWKIRKNISQNRAEKAQYIIVKKDNKNRNSDSINGHVSQQSNDNQVYFVLETTYSNISNKPLSYQSNPHLLNGSISSKYDTTIDERLAHCNENRTNSNYSKADSKVFGDLYNHLEKKDIIDDLIGQPYDTMVSMGKQTLAHNYDHCKTTKANQNSYDQELNDYDSMSMMTTQREQNFGEYDHLEKDDKATTLDDATYYARQSLEANNTDYDILSAMGMEEEKNTYFDTMQNSNVFDNQTTSADTYINHSSILHKDRNQH